VTSRIFFVNAGVNIIFTASIVYAKEPGTNLPCVQIRLSMHPHIMLERMVSIWLCYTWDLAITDLTLSGGCKSSSKLFGKRNVGCVLVWLNLFHT